MKNVFRHFMQGLVCFLFILSCENGGIPKALTVKGNPELYVPLGSPFAGMEEEDRLENLISPAGIKKMMNNSDPGSNNELEVYEVSKEMAQIHGIAPEVQTYLVQYPLAEMPLNLEDYLNKAMNKTNDGGSVNIPEIPGITEGTYKYIYGDGSPPGESEDENNPFMKIPLNDMAKLVKEVRRDVSGRFGLEIDYDPLLEQNLWIKIPSFGINDYIKGVKDNPANPSKLLFADISGNKFYPRSDLRASGDDKELWVYVRISGPCPGNYESKMIFEWESAVIDTEGNSAFNEEYPVKNKLGDFLGGGASFKRADGYVYMNGLENAEMTVNIDGATQTRSLHEKTWESELTVGTKPDGTKTVTGSLVNSSIGTPLDLLPLFNTSETILKVSVNVPETTIQSNEAADKIVKFNLYILIPMDLIISEVYGKEAPDVIIGGVNVRNKYVPLDLGDMLAKSDTGNDLFGRKEGKDNLLDDIGSVEIVLKGVDITAAEKDKLRILIKNKGDYRLLELKDNASLKYDSGQLSEPFSPEFSVLLEKDTGTSGSFKVLRSETPAFDFKLDVKAKAGIENTMEF